MLIPSIDLRGGRAVQLRQGRDPVLTAADDPRVLAERFGRSGEIAVIDLDAAMGTGDNEALVGELCRVTACRVGGGIRDHDKARRLLRAGAQRLIIGTAATPEFLSGLPRARLIAAVDARDDRVVEHGWTATASETPVARARRLARHVAGFLYTVVEREGTESGADHGRCLAFRQAVSGDVTVAGGIRTPEEVVSLDRAGMDAQVGMALYRGRFTPAACLAAVVVVEPEDGTVPTVVQDARDGRVLIVARSTPETLAASVASGEVVLHSRRRGSWRKGETSGNTMRLARVELDCDRDAVLFQVVPRGPACHAGTDSCFGDRGFSLAALEAVIHERASAEREASYTRRLFERPAIRRAKIVEEARELAEARGRGASRWEAADLLYHTLVHLAAEGLSLGEVVAELAARRPAGRSRG